MQIRTTALALCTILFACNQAPESQGTQDKPKTDSISLVSTVMTQENQVKLTPDMALKELEDGNKIFQTGKLTARDYHAQVLQTTSSQYPKAAILSCIDSRVPVEEVFDQGLGDIFVSRVAGNLVNEDILGSLEFSCKVSGAKLILVLGHANCGAIKGAIDDVKMGNLTNMLAKFKPAIMMSQNFQAEHSSKDLAYVDDVAANNVRYTIQQIRAKSPVLKEMEDKGEIKIVGAMYSLTDGAVHMIQ